jgi:hypothetical protein
MDQKRQLSLREEIAQGINSGLNNVEIYGQVSFKNPVYPADLIGVIRDLMEERKK